MIDSRPVLWWRLINDAEAVHERTGQGLARVWGLIHSGDYVAARAAMDEAMTAADTAEPA